MERRNGRVARRVAACLAALLASLALAGATPREDVLPKEIRRWSALLRDDRSKDETWLAVKEQAGPLVAGADEALRHGWPLLALQRLASARAYLTGALFVRGRSEGRRPTLNDFESEWRKAGAAIGGGSGAPDPDTLKGVSPAAARAFGEAALSQVRVYYDSSLEYGRNTVASEGLFYLGLARAQKEFASLSGSLLPPSALAPPPLRSLEPDLDRLEAELLEAYRPPAAIDRHSEFIAASATLNEARELDSAGLRFGALLKYLQSVQRVAPLRGAAPAFTGVSLSARLRELGGRLSSSGRDDSIGELFMETARADIEKAGEGKAPSAAAVIAENVLPRYFSALEPAPSFPAKAPASVTVTLVRWPYT